MRGRRLSQDGRQRFAWLPKNFGGSGRMLYALGFTDGRTKIGMTYRPRKRILQHWSASDGAVAWAHVFVQNFVGVHASRVERVACRIAGERSQRIGMTETFRGLSREAALSCVRESIAMHAKA